MKDLKRKLEQLTYEIKLVKSDEPDRMTGVMIRLEELTDLVNKLLIPDISGILSKQTKQYIDLAYIIGVFNVSGFDGLNKELTRLKEIGKKPHDIFTEGNYR